MKTFALATALVLVPATALAQPSAAPPPAEPAAAPAPVEPEPAPPRGITGGFVSVGLGVSLNVAGKGLDEWSAGGGLGSVFVGQRFGYFGVEAGLTYYGLETSNDEAVKNLGLAAAGRFQYPVTPVIAPYVRLGLEKTWLDRERAGSLDYTGVGWLAGLGVEYTLNLSFLRAAAFAELTRHDASFTNENRELDGHIDTISIGIAAGF
jgi:opacity protein-like surface antigen